MGWKHKMQGGVLGLIGFMLSPLSWWNDLFVNIPLAVAFGWMVSLVYRPAFEAAVVVGYWLTNVLGLFLMHLGARQIASKEPRRPYSRRDLLKDLAISLLYTALILVLVKLGWIQPVADYFKTG
jgi:hypothetical protein